MSDEPSWVIAVAWLALAAIGYDVMFGRQLARRGLFQAILAAVLVLLLLLSPATCRDSSAPPERDPPPYNF